MAYGTLPFRLEAHREALSALWRENMSDPRIGDVVPERIRWLYERNPAGAALTWLGVVAGDGSIVGCASIFPRHMYVNGERVSGGVLADFAVTKNHRVAGAAIAIQRAVAKGSLPAGVDFLYGYPNGKSDVIFKRLGYHFIGESSFWVKPIRSTYKLRERIRHPIALRAASAVVDAGLSFADRGLTVAHGALRRLQGESDVWVTEDLDSADARFDALWERARQRYAIMGEKTSSYLNWRYTEFTTAKHRFFCLVHPRTRKLYGYVAYAVADGKANVADLFCEHRDTQSKALLLGLARHLRTRDVQSLVFSYLGPESFGEELESIGFIRRPGVRSMVAYIDAKGSEMLRGVVFDKDAWFIIDGELDI